MPESNATTSPTRGRPPNPDYLRPDEIDVEAVKRCALVGCTYEEIAAIVGTTPQIIAEHFGEVVKSAGADLNRSLRRKQVTKALDGNVGMLVWLGKQRLGQRDKVALTGEDGGPVQVSVVEARETLKARLAAMAERSEVPVSEAPSAAPLPAAPRRSSTTE